MKSVHLGLMWRGVISVLLGLSLLGCDQGGPSLLTVEKLPDVHPNLPNVPTLPPPPHPVQYPDQSYSLYGLRHRIRQTMDTEVQLTGFIVAIYQPPECPTGHTCPPPRMPHLWIADTADEQAPEKRITLVGYAQSQVEIDDAVAASHRAHAAPPPPPESGQIPVPTDFGVGAKIKVRGLFARVSGTGFAESEGVLDYRAHETITPAPEAAPTAAAN